MKLKNLKYGILLTFTLISIVYSQSNDPMIYQRWHVLDINRVRTMFNNTGLLCDGNEQNLPLAHSPSFEFPNGSKNDYGTSIGFVIGAVGDQDTGAVGGLNVDKKYYCDASMSEGSAAYWDPQHFAAYPEIVGGSKANVSTDPANWPKNGPNKGWPANIPGINKPLLVGSEGWPGMGTGGERIADQETYSVMYGWRGIKTGTDNRWWLRTHVEMRGLAWTGELYQDFIVWIFVVRNIGNASIRDMRVGIHSDYGNLPLFKSPTSTGDDDRDYYEPRLQMAWSMDDNGMETSSLGTTLLGDQIAKCGTVALRMPGGDNKVKTYDAFHFWMEATTPKGNGADKSDYFKWNIANLDDPRDSDKDGIDDDFNMNGTPDTLEGLGGYYLGLGSDGLQTMAGAPFTLNPGQTDTLIFATVFGMTKEQLYKNARNVWTLYKSGWKTVKAPEAPKMEIAAQDGRNILYFSTGAEREKKFEGYKIYRSADNGVTWGATTFTDFGGTAHFNPLKQFDKIDSIQGHYRSIPEFAWYDLGSESGLPSLQVISSDSMKFFKRGDTVRVFVDDAVTNGLNYRYYVAAYDTGNGITGPLENTAASMPKTGTNTVEAVPHAPTAENKLSKVVVVPNPYIVADGWEQSKEKQIQFTHLPSNGTIRIFNSAGELVRTIIHNGDGLASSIAVWNLKNESNQLVAPGLYFFHFDSPLGSTTGKFIIVL